MSSRNNPTHKQVGGGGGALREDFENGCVADYARWEWNLSAYLQLVPATEVMVGDGLPLLSSNFKSPNHF